MVHLTVHLPEGCIVKCYIAEEDIKFCTEYLSNEDAIRIPSTSNIDQKVGPPMFGGHTLKVDSKLWLHAHHYVLENTTIIQTYIKDHMKWLKMKYPCQAKRQNWLQDEHMRTFTYWLQQNVLKWIPIFKCDWIDSKNGIKVDDLRYNSWRYVPIQLKDSLWDTIEASFTLDSKSRTNCMLTMDKCFRSFKNMLTIKYVIPFKDQLNVLKKPPIEYNFIKDEDWTMFVKE
ncbi:hypothetical protein AAG906_036935 [Vitis piasezkii]